MFYIYILENGAGKHYIGYTNDLEDRIRRHNTNQVKWTSKKGPWKMVYTESYESKKDAYKRERQIKSYKGGNAFKELLRRGASHRLKAGCRQRRQVVESARLATAVGGVPPEAAKAQN